MSPDVDDLEDDLDREGEEVQTIAEAPGPDRADVAVDDVILDDIERVALEDVQPYHNNPKEHPASQVGKIASSIEEFRWDQPIVTDLEGEIVKGHGRYAAAERLGLEEVPVIRNEYGSEAEKRAARIADNRSAESPWDEELLGSELELLEEDDYDLDLTAFDDDELDAFLDAVDDGAVDAGGPDGEGDGQVSDSERLQRKWEVDPGDVYRLEGDEVDHTLVCADNLEVSPEQLGYDHVDLLVTDPPYGIDIVEEDGHIGNAHVDVTVDDDGRGSIDGTNELAVNRYKSIEGDDREFDPEPYLDVAETTVLFGANNYADKLPPSSGWVVWDKRDGGESDNFSDGELAWTDVDGKLRIYRQLWRGMIKAGENSKRMHPTQKPIGLFEYVIEVFSEPGDLVLDPFVGSGSAILGADKIDRPSLSFDLEPEYVAVCLERATDAGLDVELVDRVAVPDADVDGGDEP